MTRFAFQMSRHMRLFELIRQQELAVRAAQHPSNDPASAGSTADRFKLQALSSFTR